MRDPQVVVAARRSLPLPFGQQGRLGKPTDAVLDLDCRPLQFLENPNQPPARRPIRQPLQEMDTDSDQPADQIVAGAPRPAVQRAQEHSVGMLGDRLVVGSQMGAQPTDTSPTPVEGQVARADKPIQMGVHDPPGFLHPAFDDATPPGIRGKQRPKHIAVEPATSPPRLSPRDRTRQLREHGANRGHRTITRFRRIQEGHRSVVSCLARVRTTTATDPKPGRCR